MPVKVDRSFLRKSTIPKGAVHWMRWPIGAKWSMWHIRGVHKPGDVSACTACGIFPRLAAQVQTVDRVPAGEKTCHGCTHPGGRGKKRISKVGETQ